MPLVYFSSSQDTTEMIMRLTSEVGKKHAIKRPEILMNLYKAADMGMTDQ